MKIIKLHPEIAAEIRGVSMADVANDDNAYRAVRAAFEEHSVLLFRQQPMGTELDQIQVGYSATFGPLETAKVASLGEGTPFSILTNIDKESGGLVPQGSAARQGQPTVAHTGAGVGVVGAHYPRHWWRNRIRVDARSVESSA